MFWSVQQCSIEEHCLNDEQRITDEPGAAESDKLEGHGISFQYFILIYYIYIYVYFI